MSIYFSINFRVRCLTTSKSFNHQPVGNSYLSEWPVHASSANFRICRNIWRVYIMFCIPHVKKNNWRKMLNQRCCKLIKGIKRHQMQQKMYCFRSHDKLCPIPHKQALGKFWPVTRVYACVFPTLNNLSWVAFRARVNTIAVRSTDDYNQSVVCAPLSWSAKTGFVPDSE